MMTAGNLHYLISWAGASVIVISLAVAWIMTHDKDDGGDE